MCGSQLTTCDLSLYVIISGLLEETYCDGISRRVLDVSSVLLYDKADSAFMCMISIPRIRKSHTAHHVNHRRMQGCPRLQGLHALVDQHDKVAEWNAAHA